jgi:hypothetical protein
MILHAFYLIIPGHEGVNECVCPGDKIWSTTALFREVPLELLSGMELLLVAVNKNLMRYYHNTISSH